MEVVGRQKALCSATSFTLTNPSWASHAVLSQALDLLMQDLPMWGRAWCALRKAPDSAVSCAVMGRTVNTPSLPTSNVCQNNA